ncbi:hypothetical protein WME75_35885 [Sorangium sp. So ce1014]|uniref:hypothetical protein n=1 Tax=Sorangium sp. So ce1014 TaxID=3133326 RepID=UPI003F61F912
MSKPFSHGPMFDLLGSLMRGARLAPIWACAILQIGCGESTEISGRAVVTMLSILSGMPEDNKVFLMDTGTTGSNAVETGDEWDITCGAGGDRPPFVNLTNVRLSTTDPLPLEFITIFLRESDGIVRDPPQEENVAVALGVYYYSGICEVTFTKTNDSPYEADIRSSVCRDLKAPDGIPARLDSAEFHIKCCEDDC